MPEFPYMNLKITSLLLLTGIFLATFNNVLLDLAIATGAGKTVIIALLNFIGIFITGWALLSFGFAKQLLPIQRTVALFFAAVLIVGLFGVSVVFHFNIA